MKRTPIAAAIAAVFMLCASSLFAQTYGGGTGSTATPPSTSGTPGSTMAPSTSRSTTGSSADTSKATTSDAKLAHGDRKFIEKAAHDNLAEVELGKLASQKATDPAVKSFADQMVKDHGDANQKLTTIAQSKGVNMPTSLSHSDERHLRKLEKLSGAKFDQTYVKDMMKGHKADAKAFDKEAQKAKDPDVKQFAAETAPVIHQHLSQITDINDTVRKGGTTSSRTTSPKTTTGSTSSAMPSTASAAPTSSSASSPPPGSAPIGTTASASHK